MPSNRSQFVVAASVTAALHLAAASVSAQLRIVTYNNSGSNSGAGSQLSTILKAIGDEAHAGIAKPLDIISLQEQDRALLSTDRVVNLLNSLYGAGTYRASTITGAGDTTQSVVYNTQSVQLTDQKAFLPTGTSGAARQSMRFEFRPVGYTATADFYVYSNHYKAGDTTTDMNRRNVEAQGVRADGDALGGGARILYTGDFNVYYSNESMYKTLTTAGNGQAIDPIGRPGNWHSSSAFADIYTQSPVNAGSAYYTGQTGGGMDDRFDFQLASSAMLSGRGVSYIPNTYHAFGNAGVQLNQDIDAAGAAALLGPNFPGYSTAQIQSVLHALAVSGDHIPVVADYRVPAKMGVTLNPLQSKVIVGASVNASLAIANTASAITVDSADRLDFTATGAGAVSGNVTGADNALGAAAQVNLPLDTASPGLKTGAVQVSSSSPGVANGEFSTAVQYTVLAHSNASFGASSDQNTLSVDLTAAPDGKGSASVNLYNLAAGAFPTAGLRLIAMTETGDSGDVLDLMLPAFDALAAGNAASLLIQADGLTVGTVVEATYLLKLGDEALPGATVGSDLILHVTAHAVPEAGMAALFACVAAVGGLRRPRKS